MNKNLPWLHSWAEPQSACCVLVSFCVASFGDGVFIENNRVLRVLQHTASSALPHKRQNLKSEKEVLDHPDLSWPESSEN